MAEAFRAAFLRFSLRTNLLLLLLGVAGILVADRIREVAQARAAAVTSAREEILAITADSARRQADLVSDARAILTLAAALPESDGRSLTGCQVPFRRAVKARPWLISLTVIHPTGMAVCTSADRLLPRSLADREYFRNAIATRGLVLSDYIISRLTGQPIIVAAMPRIENSRVESVVSASIDVSSFPRASSPQTAPEAHGHRLHKADTGALHCWRGRRGIIPNPRARRVR